MNDPEPQYSDKFRIDSHKLIYHVDRVQQWLAGKNIYPIYMEIGLYGGCNQRCIFCAFDYLEYKPNILDEKSVKKFISCVKKQGIKSIMYAGEGEPLLHKDISSIIHFTKKCGIDVAITSNAVMLSQGLAEDTLPYLSWFRASINAGQPKTYSLIHQSGTEDFSIVLRNLREAVKIKNRNKYKCSIGAQFVLIPQNKSEAVVLAEKLNDVGLDYLIIKPYSHHPRSKSSDNFNIRPEDLFYIEDKIRRYSKGGFQIIFRKNAMNKLREEKKHYKNCPGLPFAAFISASGDVYPCNLFFGNRDFSFGNIRREKFSKIWEGNRRKRIISLINNSQIMRKCRKACRLDEINRYLWKLKYPDLHVNFI